MITVANTWISTAETITQTGAKPVFVDIDSNHYTIDVDKIEEKITPKTKAIIPVHLYGQSCNMDKITQLCRDNNLYLIEDCAQAHFSEWKNKKVGTFGIAGTFSFFPGKNLGAYGDAGAIITDNDDFAIKARKFANHGALKKHHHDIEGINSRLDGIQAGILLVKLRYIKKWNIDRLNNALYYNQLLSDHKNVIAPNIEKNGKHVFHLYVVRCINRDGLFSKLKELGIDCAIHYPTPLPFLKAYSYLNHKPEDFPIALSYSKGILSLPMYPELSKEQIEHVALSIDSFYR